MIKEQDFYKMPLSVPWDAPQAPEDDVESDADLWDGIIMGSRSVREEYLGERKDDNSEYLWISDIMA